MVSTMTKAEYMQMYDLVGACMEVYNTAGRGMSEPIYQEMLEIELGKAGVEFEREKKLSMYYKGQRLKKEYYADFYSHGVILELKSVVEIKPEHRAQLFNYARMTKTRRCILINFGEASLHAERYLYQDEEDDFALVKKSNLDIYVRDE